MLSLWHMGTGFGMKNLLSTNVLIIIVDLTMTKHMNYLTMGFNSPTTALYAGTRWTEVLTIIKTKDLCNYNIDFLFSEASMLRTNEEFVRKCSNCGCTFDILKISKPIKHCPYCGRKIRS